jgi:hypothetical protein
MKARLAAPIGIVIGGIVGYLFILRQGDMLIGGITAVLWAIIGYGSLAYPEILTRRAGSQARFWSIFIVVLTPIVMLLTPMSTLLVDGLPVVVLLGGIWLGGIYSGIALERNSKDSPDN